MKGAKQKSVSRPLKHAYMSLVIDTDLAQINNWILGIQRLGLARGGTSEADMALNGCENHGQNRPAEKRWALGPSERMIAILVHSTLGKTIKK